MIKNRCNYIQEGMRLLHNQEYYSSLEQDPTRNFNAKIIYIITQVTNLNIIDDSMQRILYHTFSRNSNFYRLLKIHKAINPGRPIVNSAETSREKISAYIDEHLRPLISRIHNNIKDTSYFLNLMRGRKLKYEEL